MGLGGGLSHPIHKYSPQTKGSPLALLGWGLCVLLDLSKKEPAAGGSFFSLPKILVQTSAKISPPKPKILATSLFFSHYYYTIFVQKR